MAATASAAEIPRVTALLNVAEEQILIVENIIAFAGRPINGRIKNNNLFSIVIYR